MIKTLSWRKKVVLAVWCAFGTFLVFVVLSLMAGWPNALSVIFMIVGIACTAYMIAASGSVEAAREQRFLDTYGSLDGAKAALDLDALRAVRDTQGKLPAIRQVLHQHPAIPLAQAAEIVRGL